MSNLQINVNFETKRRLHLKKFWNKLKKKFLVVTQDPSTFSQLFSIKTSRLQIFLVITCIFSLLIGGTLYLSRGLKSSGKISVESEEIIFENNSRIDSLRKVIAVRDYFIKDIQKVLRGEKFADSNLSMEKPESLGDSIVFDFSKSNADSILKAEIENDRSLENNNSFGNNEFLRGTFFFSPVKGMVSQSFNKKTGHFGVDVVGNKDETIKAVLDGYVVYAGWSDTDGRVVIIDHRNGLISCYKHNSSLMKKIGDKVQAGDPIAIIGNTGELSKGYHLHLELWYNGQAIDPQEFITFY